MQDVRWGGRGSFVSYTTLLSFSALVDQVSHVSLALSAATTTVTTAATSLQEPVLMQPLDPVLGAAPLGRVRLTKERSSQLAMLDSASQHLPQAADSERVR